MAPRILTAGFVMAMSAVATNVAQAQTVTEAHANSGKYQAHRAWILRMGTRAAIGGRSDTLSEYAAKCDAATGIHVPAFNCDDGTEVPGQGDVPATRPNATRCDQPNVLNRHCDPGSKFQVLPGGTADAVAVAHCRKVGLPVNGSIYNDIAVIQYNKKNGAMCFYQALTNLPGQNVPAPLSVGENPWQPTNAARWISPANTEGIGCTGCHDNGGFIRSEYLAQLKTPPNVLPNTASGFNNLNTSVKYVGLDYATNRSWSITAPAAHGDVGSPCTTCHRLAVPNRMAFGRINGTAAHFAQVATAATQDSKNPHSQASPIWMRPGQITYDSEAEKSATNFHNCAVGFFESGFTSPPSGCVVTPLGVPFEPLPTGSAEKLVPVLDFLLNDLPEGQFRDADMTITSYPGTLRVGQTGTVSIIVTNTGNVLWAPGNYILQLSRLRRISLPSNNVQLLQQVNPGQSLPLSFAIVCAGQGSGGFSAQMSGGGDRFGASKGATVVCQP